jgi:hypothetical protein
MSTDPSLRVKGRYGLKFEVIRICLPPNAAARPNQIIAQYLNDVFVVYAAKNSPPNDAKHLSIPTGRVLQFARRKEDVEKE